MKPWFDRIAPQRVGIHLRAEDRDHLESLGELFRDLLVADDSSLYRLFPPVVMDDVAANEEYHSLMRGELTKRRLDSLDAFNAALTESEISDTQLWSVLTTMNDIRLVMSAMLGIHTDEDLDRLYGEIGNEDERLALLIASETLGFLIEQAVDVLSDSLPATIDDEDE